DLTPSGAGAVLDHDLVTRRISNLGVGQGQHGGCSLWHVPPVGQPLVAQWQSARGGDAESNLRASVGRLALRLDSNHWRLAEPGESYRQHDSGDEEYRFHALPPTSDSIGLDA